MFGLKTYLMGGIVMSVIALGGYSYWKTKQVWNLKAKVVNLKQEVEDMEFGAQLATELRKENIRLREQNAVAMLELQNVSDYNTPLSIGLIGILERVQRENSGTSRTPE